MAISMLQKFYAFLYICYLIPRKNDSKKNCMHEDQNLCIEFNSFCFSFLFIFIISVMK